MAGQYTQHRKEFGDGGAKPPEKKRRAFTALGIAAGALAVIVLAVLAVLHVFSEPAEPVQITRAFTTTDPIAQASPAPMDFYTPVTREIYLYGEADHLTGDTRIELDWLQWNDQTGEETLLSRTTAQVDAGEGVFHSAYQLPVDDTFGLTLSGRYRVDVIVDGGEAPGYTVVFEVYSMPKPRIKSDLINDAYMIAPKADGSFRPVTRYETGTEEITLIVSFSAMGSDTGWMPRWLYKEDGDWSEVRAASAGFAPVARDPGPGLYARSLSAETGAFAPGEYMVEAYLSEAPDTPAAAVIFAVEGDETIAAPVLQEIVMTTGLDQEGAPVDEVTEYPLGTRSFICCFYYSGSGANAVEWEWQGPGGPMGERQRERMTEEGYYWVRYDHPEGLSFPAGDYRLVLYLPGQGDTPAAEIPFSVTETATLPMADLDAGSLPLTEDAWAEWNDWLMTFTEGRLPTFEGALPPDGDLIDFAVLYNYFYNEDMYATLDEYGVCWLTESALSYTLWWFLDAEVAHGSTGMAMYEGGSYGYKAPEEAPHYVFPQVRGIYEHEEEGFILEFDVYTAPEGFSDFNGDYESWESGDAIPKFQGEMRAWVRWVHEGDTARRVLSSYARIE